MKIIRFINKVFEPKLHILFSFLWSSSLLSVVSVQYGVYYKDYDIITLTVIPLSFFLLLLFLRMIDEIKDYEYDKLYKPDRPLVTGMVSFKQVKIYAICIAVIVLSINLLLSWKCSIFLLGIISYGLFLLILEKKSKIIANNIFLNLLVTFPVSSALNFYVIFYILFIREHAFNVDLLWIVLAYMCIFLHFEFGRKTIWPHLLEKGEKVYARYIGGIGSSLVALILCIIGCSILFNFSRSNNIWVFMVFLPLLLNTIAIAFFLKKKQKRMNLYPFYGGAVLVSYLIVLIINL